MTPAARRPRSCLELDGSGAVRGCSCGWQRPRPPIPARTRISRGFGPACRPTCRRQRRRSPDLEPGITSLGNISGSPAPAATAIPDPARLNKGIPCQAGGRHGPGQAGPASRAPRPRCKVAVACHVPIRATSRLGTCLTCSANARRAGGGYRLSGRTGRTRASAIPGVHTGGRSQSTPPQRAVSRPAWRGECRPKPRHIRFRPREREVGRVDEARDLVSGRLVCPSEALESGTLFVTRTRPSASAVWKISRSDRARRTGSAPRLPKCSCRDLAWSSGAVRPSVARCWRAEWRS